MKQIFRDVAFFALAGFMLTGCSRNQEQPKKIERQSTLRSNPRSEVYGPRLPYPFNQEAIKKLGETIVKSTSTKQFLCFQDTDHFYPALKEFIATDAMMDTFAAYGVKHIFLESPVQLQGLADDFANGKMSSQVYSGIMEHAAMSLVAMAGGSPERIVQAGTDIITKAKKRGIKVHFVDSQKSFFPPQHFNLMSEILEKSARAMQHHIENDPDFFKEPDYKARQRRLFSAVKKIILNLTPEQREIYFTVMKGPENLSNVETIKQRMAEDRDTAALISSIAGREKSVLFYGAAHFMRASNDIDYFLGGKAYTIAVWASQKHRVERQPENIRLLKEAYEQTDLLQPDADIVVFDLIWQPKSGKPVSFGNIFRPVPKPLQHK